LKPLWNGRGPDPIKKSPGGVGNYRGVFDRVKSEKRTGPKGKEENFQPQ